MSITNRLSLFFLVALAIVLIGFSAAMYGLAYWHLQSQLDRQLEADMNLLMAAIEVHPRDVQWEPLERQVSLGNAPALNQVRWILKDEQGHLIDCSANLKDEFGPLPRARRSRWRTLFRQVNAGQFTALVPESRLAPTSPNAIAALPADRTATRKSFVIAVALSEVPVQALLANLAFALMGVSVSLWCGAAVWGRWLCKRALSPVTAMAEKARLLQQAPASPTLLDPPLYNDELSELAQAFNQLLVSLRESIELQQRFAGDASHQLRTPLTAMLAAVDVALRHQRDPEEYQRVLAVVQRRGRELQQIVEILLSLTRRNPAEESLQTEQLDLNAWCQTRIASWQNHPRWDAIELRLSSTPLPVRAQPTLLGQIFDNLLDNACKYSDAGTPITIRTSQREAQAMLRIEDRGLGIPRDELEQIFEPFFRSAEARNSGEVGTGLGLTVAQRLADVMAGSLEVESSEGHGSSFQLLLPLAMESSYLSREPEASTMK